MLKKLLSLLFDAFVYGTGTAMGQIISLLLLPLYTKRLDPGDYGILSMLALMPVVFLTLAAGGMKTALFREFYRVEDAGQRRRIISTALWSVWTATAAL